LALDASSSRVDYTSQHAELRVWSRRAAEPATPAIPPRPAVEISEEARRRHRAESAGGASGSDACDCACGCRHDEEALDEMGGDMRLTVLKLLLERLTGHHIELLKPSDLHHHDHGDDDHPQAEPATPATPARAATEWGVEFDSEEIHYESEQASFHATGAVTTTDGRQIAFQVDVAMSREYLEKKEIHIREGAAKVKDPLALSLDGAPVTLTPAKLSFDLDADGHPENISFVAPGAAFLALDRNGNGTVDDGSELFGPRSGDGYADLAVLDEDRNGWIDEADPEFANLRLWERSADGENRVRSLAEAGVGAIALANVATPFTQATAGNEVLGETRATGLYVRENGAAGVVQQVDLAI
jgi:hypothetical protein